MNLDIFLTTHCNMLCSFCGANVTNEASFIDTGEVEKILEAGKEYGFRYTTFSGGEPLTHPNLFEILDISDNLGYWSNITTNGLLIDQELINFIKNKKINIRVSLHTLNDKKHEKITGTATLANIIENIQLLNKNKIYFSIGCTLFAENIDEIEDLVKFAYKEGAAYIRFTPVVGMRKGKDYATDGEFYEKALIQIIDEILKYKDSIMYEKSNLPISDEFISMITTRRCPAGSSLFMIVDSNKNVIPCQFIPMDKKWHINKSLNIQKNFFKLKDKISLKFNEAKLNEFEGICKGCDYVDTCLGGCLGNKLPYDLDINSEQPICIYKIMKKLIKNFTNDEKDFLFNYWDYYYKQRITNRDNTRFCMRKLPIWEVNYRMDINRE